MVNIHENKLRHGRSHDLLADLIAGAFEAHTPRQVIHLSFPSVTFETFLT